MEFIREYWWLIVIVAVALLAAVILLRPRQRVRLSDSAPVRPHMAQSVRPEGRGLAGEAAAAASDVTGELFGADVHRELAGNKTSADDFCRMKGVGPKFAGALHATRIDAGPSSSMAFARRAARSARSSLAPPYGGSCGAPDNVAMAAAAIAAMVAMRFGFNAVVIVFSE
jgi:hypothetical protein